MITLFNVVIKGNVNNTPKQSLVKTHFRIGTELGQNWTKFRDIIREIGKKITQTKDLRKAASVTEGNAETLDISIGMIGQMLRNADLMRIERNSTPAEVQEDLIERPHSVMLFSDEKSPTTPETVTESRENENLIH